MEFLHNGTGLARLVGHSRPHALHARRVVYIFDIKILNLYLTFRLEYAIIFT